MARGRGGPSAESASEGGDDGGRTRVNRGRDTHYWAPPAQIRTGPIRASGSHLGCLTAKRWFGQGWRMRGLGSQSLALLTIRSQVIPALWPRRSRERRQRWRTWVRNALRAGRLVGTAW